MSNIITIGSECKGIWGKRIINFLVKAVNSNYSIIWENSNNCNFIVKSHFNKIEPPWNNDNKNYILWSGEAYIPSIPQNAKRIIYIITTFIDTPLMCYIPYVLDSPYLYKQKLNNSISRKYLIAYCSSNKVPVREQLFDLFVEKTGADQCHSLGKNFGSYMSTQRRVEGSWESEDLVETYTKYKFVFAMENSDVHGYVTEKIMNAFHSGAIPIYWGTKYVKELFNEKAFIYVNDFSCLQECVDFVVDMSDEDREKMMNEPIYHPTNEVIHLMDDDFNKKNGNKTLDNYLKRMKYILS
jgi:hypothetical protein